MKKYIDRKKLFWIQKIIIEYVIFYFYKMIFVL